MVSVAGPAEALSTSESEEMYLIHIAMAGEEGIEGAVPLRVLATMLSKSPVSVNQMVKKLAGRDLVRYTPYRGVELTESGRRIALRVLRGRRLWAVFLAERLGFSAGEADAIACDLEHITPPEVADRLAGLLDDPATGPGGRAIPRLAGPVEAQQAVALPSVPVGGQATVVRVEAPGTTEAFLRAQGVGAGGALTVLGAAAGGDRLIETETGRVHVTGDIARAVWVRTVPSP